MRGIRLVHGHAGAVSRCECGIATRYLRAEPKLDQFSMRRN